MAHVVARPFDLRTAAPFGISRGTHREFERFVIEMRQGDLVGLGESAPNARFGEERQRDMDLLAELAPEIADLEGPAAVEAYCEALAAQGVPALRAGLSAAAWDLAGKQAGEPVWRMLGLARPSVRTSYTIALGAPEEMLAQARAASAFGTLKVKLGFAGDLEVARRLKLALPETTFRYDVNEGWDRERAAAALAVLEDLDAELVEQPLPATDTEGMAWLKERTRLPLLADEAVLTLDDLDAVGDACDGVVIKLAKAGGLAAAFALISACTQLGLRVMLGCMVESSLGIAAGLQLAGLADFVDLDGALLLGQDPFEGIEAEGDLLTASDEPGLGIRPAARA
ncbi:MAG TPA: enolase C-terminal domain-like protein [Thermoleophilia bacterium]|nr:enolase C-terminal domain-like protein [Thermoleophilia bacterium]